MVLRKKTYAPIVPLFFSFLLGGIGPSWAKIQERSELSLLPLSSRSGPAYPWVDLLPAPGGGVHPPLFQISTEEVKKTPLPAKVVALPKKIKKKISKKNKELKEGLKEERDLLLTWTIPDLDLEFFLPGLVAIPWPLDQREEILTSELIDHHGFFHETWKTHREDPWIAQLLERNFFLDFSENKTVELSPREMDVAPAEIKQLDEQPSGEADKVHLVQAGKEIQEDLVFYSYSGTASPKNSPIPPAKNEPAPLAAAPSPTITPTVYKAIQREMENLPQVHLGKRSSIGVAASPAPTKKLSPPPPIVASSVNSAATLAEKYPDFAEEKERSTPPPPGQATKETFREDPPFSNKPNSILRIKMTDADMEKGLGEELNEFDFRPYYSFSEILSDSGAGVLEIEGRLRENISILAGAFYKKGKVITNVDLTLEKGGIEYNVPMISVDSLDKFLDKYKLKGQGGFLLVEMDEDVTKVDLDRGYEAKIPLDRKLRVVEGKKSSDYVLFVGVRPGNNVITYTTLDNEPIRKILNIEEQELYFELNSFLEKKVNIFELYEGHLFGSVPSELNIEPSDIIFFNGIKKTKRRGLNRYELTNLKIPLGTRMYFELSHLKEGLFLGKWDGKKLHLPSNEYIVQIFNALGVNDLVSQCLVQINLTGAGKDFIYEGRAVGGINLRALFLEKDGSFSDEISERTTKIFLLGDNEGMVSGKLDYLNGSVDYLNTFCSKDTYLIEQF